MRHDDFKSNLSGIFFWHVIISKTKSGRFNISKYAIFIKYFL